jgi:carnitine 3-dehydrogenase
MRSIIFGPVDSAWVGGHDPSREMTFSFQKRIRRIAVIGCGPMAVSWAAYYFTRGFDVVAADPAQKTTDNLRQYMDSLFGAVLDPDQPGATRGTLRLASDLDEALLRADYIQECATGKASGKINLLAQIDRCTRPDSVIASDADLSIMNAVQSILHFGDRCVIARSLDLPHLNPFTCVIKAAGTSPLAIKQAIEFHARAGRLPIYLRGEVSEEFTGGLLAMFRREAVQLRELDIMSEFDLHDFGSWAPSLCCSALVSAMQAAPDGIHGAFIGFPDHPNDTSDRAALDDSEGSSVAVAFERSDKSIRSRDNSISGSGISPSPACVP